jgi:hypothetical protein
MLKVALANFSMTIIAKRLGPAKPYGESGRKS